MVAGLPVAIRAGKGCSRMTGAEIMAVVGFILLLFGYAFGVWKYVDGKITSVRDDLASHKLHAAETFATKSGMAEQTNQLLRAIESIGNRIDSLGERMDRVFEQRANRRSN